MKMFKNWKIKENIKTVLKMYPIVLLGIFLIGALSIFSIHSDVDKDLIVKINFSIAIFVGFALVLRALTVTYEKFNKIKYMFLLLLSAIISAAYYFTLDIHNDWSIMRTFIILFIQVLLFISLPFLKSDETSEHFANLAAGRLVISGLLYGIAYGGVAGILFALEELFGLDISSKVYQDSAIILATTFLPMLWLFGLDYKVKPSTSRLYRVLLSYVCIPLLFVYSLVVYGFILKIVFDGFIMPSSIIGNLVLWYSLVSIIVTYLARPYQDNSITSFFYKWYPLISILPITVMFIAIFMRINQYAITINRYYMLMGGIWLAVMFGYLIFIRFARKKRLNVFTTLTLALFALISIAEPISAETIAEHSQLNRLEKIMGEYTTAEGVLVLSEMNDENKKQAQDILNYLSWQHDGYQLQNDSSENFDKNISYMTKEQAKEILQADLSMYDFKREGIMYYYVESRGNDRTISTVEIADYKYMVNIDSFDFNNGDIYSFDNYQIDVINVFDNDEEFSDSIIKLYKDNELISDLSLLECFGNTLMNKGGDFGNNYTDYVYETPDKAVKIILFSVEFKIDEEISIGGFSGYILFK